MKNNNSIVDYYLNNRKEFKTDHPQDILIKKLIKLIPKYETLKVIIGIDVGCNVGNYIKNLLKICNEDNAKILCFEPNPKIYLRLRKKLF